MLTKFSKLFAPVLRKTWNFGVTVIAKPGILGYFLLDICNMRGREKPRLKAVTIILQGYPTRIFGVDFNWGFSLPLTHFWPPGRFSSALMVFVEWHKDKVGTTGQGWRLELCQNPK